MHNFGVSKRLYPWIRLDASRVVVIVSNTG